MKGWAEMDKNNKKYSFTLMDIISAFITSWLFVSGLSISLFASAGVDLAFTNVMKLPIFVILIVLAAIVIFAVNNFLIKSKNISPYSFIISLLFFAFCVTSKRNDITTYIIMLAVVSLALYCFNEKYKPSLINQDFSNGLSWFFIAVAVLFAFTCVCSIGVFRYYTYSAPNYDFGIFCNMFYNMSKNGSAVTTCERDTLLSHFAVHISPIFYLILPFYWLFSSPVTLAVVQPVVVFSAVIPIYLLAKHFNLSKNATTLFTISFALYAPLSTGCFYDLHENCFLVPLLLWMFYFFEKDNKILTFIFMFGVLFVKEDAFVYILIFALYIIVSRKKYLTGTIMAFSACGYFLLCCFLLTKYGTGIMASRYGNLSQSGSLFDAAKTILINPGYAIGEMLETKDESAEKIFYLVKLFCPLAFIPFMSKDFTRYILILPIFINLLTKYTYQYDITFQYTFGICTFLFYLSVLNLSEKNTESQNKLTFLSFIASIMLFVMIVVPKSAAYMEKYYANHEQYAKITQALEIIPEEAEVTASTYFLPHIANRDVIYEDEYHDKPTTEYFVLDTSRSVAKGREKMYLDAGYVLIYKIDGLIEIYQNPNMKN